MKKNHGFPYKWGIKMRYVLLVIQVALFLPQWGHASNNVLLPGPKISFSMKDALMKDVIWELEKRSGFVFAYNANDLLKAGKVSVEVKDKDVYEALDICLKGTGLTYVFQNEVIVLKPLDDEKKKGLDVCRATRCYRDQAGRCSGAGSEKGHDYGTGCR